MKIRRAGKVILGLFTSIVLLGFVVPEALVIPVKNATINDWNHNTFWYEPWGKSGVHKGIDIFGRTGTPVMSPARGIVLFRGTVSLGGNVVLILGPRWRLHYLAHLDEIDFNASRFVFPGSQVGTLGASGNAIGKQPHLHYSIVTLFPYPWRMTTETQGWKKMFFLNPHAKLGGV
jgi:murein DD-endopeptidase MepM/ murein hydrolase activator NlpD